MPPLLRPRARAACPQCVAVLYVCLALAVTAARGEQVRAKHGAQDGAAAAAADRSLLAGRAAGSAQLRARRDRWGFVGKEIAKATTAICCHTSHGSQRSRAHAGTCPRGHGRFKHKHCACPTDPGRPHIYRCEACDAGYFGDGAARRGCGQCPAGWVAPAQGAAGCTKCGKGTYSEGGWAGCRGCSVGMHNPHEGQGHCVHCDQGTFAAGTGSAACAACPRGYFSLQYGHEYPRACPQGGRNFPYLDSTHADVAARGVQCRRMPTRVARSAYPAGHRLRGWAVDEYDCPDGCTKVNVQCVVGSHGGDPPCRTVQHLSANVLCTRGPLGWRAHPDRADQCAACPPGQAGTLARGGCEACAAGKYAATAGQPACWVCDSGRYEDGVGSVACKLCPKGKHVDVVAGTGCKACRLGRFAAAADTAACTLCPKGWNQDVTGQHACKQCPKGSVAKDAGLVNCADCPAGWRTDGDDCAACRVGRSTHGASGQTECKLCRSGRFGERTGQKACTECGPSSHVVNGGRMLTWLGETDSAQCICEVDDAKCRLPWGQAQESPTWSREPVAEASFGEYQVRFGYPGKWTYMPKATRLSIAAGQERFECGPQGFVDLHAQKEYACEDTIPDCATHKANGGCSTANADHLAWRTSCVRTCDYCHDPQHNPALASLAEMGAARTRARQQALLRAGGGRAASVDLNEQHFATLEAILMAPGAQKPNDNWCTHRGAVHQVVEGCGRVCSGPGSQRGVKGLGNWPNAPCAGEGSCEQAKWPSCKAPSEDMQRDIARGNVRLVAPDRSNPEYDKVSAAASKLPRSDCFCVARLVADFVRLICCCCCCCCCCFGVPAASVAEPASFSCTPHDASQGRLEVKVAGTWGTVCRDNFRADDATVACKQLGYNDGRFVSSAGTGPWAVNENTFKPVVARLSDCASDSLDVTKCANNAEKYASATRATGKHCTHANDVVIQCENSHCEYKKSRDQRWRADRNNDFACACQCLHPRIRAGPNCMDCVRDCGPGLLDAAACTCDCLTELSGRTGSFCHLRVRECAYGGRPVDKANPGIGSKKGSITACDCQKDARGRPVSTGDRCEVCARKCDHGGLLGKYSMHVLSVAVSFVSASLSLSLSWRVATYRHGTVLHTKLL